MSFKLGYNTNGFPHHRLIDAIDILSEMGYRSIGITLDHHHLNPLEPFLAARTADVRRHLDKYDMSCVVETGARFLLNPRLKHQPTLVDADAEARRHRMDYLKHAIAIARDLGAKVVSIWSGVQPAEVTEKRALSSLTTACSALCAFAEARGVTIAFEPEPGMFIETMDQYRALRDKLNHPRFALTLDLGHVHCLADGDPAERIREFAGDLRNIHIEDMRRGTHEHLMFGDGEMDFPAIFAALREIKYEGGVYVELSRHGHDAVNTAKQAFDFLSRL